MKLNLFIASAVLFTTVAGGCAPDNDRDDFMSGGAGRGGAVPVDRIDMNDLVTLEKLDTVPAPVRNDFRRRYPDAGVTSVQQLDAATGVLLYDINFIRNGKFDDVIYRADGTTLTRTPLVDQAGGL